MLEVVTIGYNLELYKHFHTHTVNNDSGRMSYDYLDGDLKIHYNIHQY